MSTNCTPDNTADMGKKLKAADMMDKRTCEHRDGQQAFSLRSNPSIAHPTNEDWTIHREFITQLYLTEKKTLAVVKDVMMREHGFFASDKMYKTRFKQWNIDKTLNWQETMSALTVIVQSASAGYGPRLIMIGGRQVTVFSVQQYLRKRPDGQAYLDVLQRSLRESGRMKVHCSKLSDEFRYAHRFLHCLNDWGTQCLELRVWIADQGPDSKLWFPAMSTEMWTDSDGLDCWRTTWTVA